MLCVMTPELTSVSSIFQYGCSTPKIRWDHLNCGYYVPLRDRMPIRQPRYPDVYLFFLFQIVNLLWALCLFLLMLSRTTKMPIFDCF